ncbi:alanine-phosphoribitol ligase, partial [Mycobacterium kansasii]
LDLASLRSVRQFADSVRQLDIPPLKALVCNAGLQLVGGSHTTAEGYELTWGVNHLGHFALTQHLLDAVTVPARIVMVSSGTHDPDKFT